MKNEILSASQNLKISEKIKTKNCKKGKKFSFDLLADWFAYILSNENVFWDQIM